MLIVATIGLNSSTENKITKIILAGANIIRYNFAHRLIAERIENVILGKSIIDNLNSNTKIMVDLPTNKVRLGNFDSIFYPVIENQEITLKSGTYSHDCTQYLPIEVDNIGEKVTLNQTITIGDGEIAFQIANIIDSNTIIIKALNNGIIKTMKTFNANLFIKENNYLQYCKNILDKVSELELDYLVIPYINKNLYEKMVTLLDLKTRREKKIIRIMGKITVEEITFLFQNPLFSMVIIDLGEIGVNMPFAEIGNYYKKIMDVKSKYKKNVLVMSQLFESVINNYIPYRAEILNLANMIKDNINGLVLCHETALGARPAYAINIVKRIIEETQHS